MQWLPLVTVVHWTIDQDRHSPPGNIWEEGVTRGGLQGTLVHSVPPVDSRLYTETELLKQKWNGRTSAQHSEPGQDHRNSQLIEVREIEADRRSAFDSND